MRLLLAVVVALLSTAPVSHAEGPAAPAAAAARADKPLHVSVFIGDFTAKPDRSRLTRSGGGYGWGLGGDLLYLAFRGGGY